MTVMLLLMSKYHLCNIYDTTLYTDLPMVNDKIDVLANLTLPTLAACGSGSDVASQSYNDGQAVDATATRLSKQACDGIPSNWKQHSGSLQGAASGSYAYGIVSNSDVRRVERFRKNKTTLVRQAQLGAKSIYNAG